MPLNLPLRSPRSLLLGNRPRHATVLVDTVVADGFAASRAFHSVLFAAGGFTAIHTGQSNGPTFDGVVAGAVAFRNNGHFTTELLGLHVAHATSCHAPTQTAEAALAGAIDRGRQG